MMDEASVYRELADVFSDVFLRSDIPLSPDLTAKDVEGWDSFKQIEIIIAVEQRFAMKFSSKEVDSMRSLGDLVTIVCQRGKISG